MMRGSLVVALLALALAPLSAEDGPAFEGVKGATIAVKGIGFAKSFELPSGPDRTFDPMQEERHEFFTPKQGRVLWISIEITAVEGLPKTLDLTKVVVVDPSGAKAALVGFALGRTPEKVPAIDHQVMDLEAEGTIVSQKSSGDEEGEKIGQVTYDIGGEKASLVFKRVPSVLTLVFVVTSSAKALTLQGLFEGTLRVAQ